ncbi:hypothetical protein EIP86_005024 [Pleurotus ostreatoroseus]|nr:hypothetical protein EIP86_005024 [Pleurotus ostreatoroseus]
MDVSMSNILCQMFPPKPKWTTEDIPDLTGKVCLVTGGNTGIGKETCKRLLMKNAIVYMAARSQHKAEEAIKGLKEETGKEARFLQLDLADLDSVKRSAEEFKQHEEKLNVLFLNAGVMVPPIEQLTSQGYDMQFGTNVLGHFLFLKLLYPLLSASSSPSAPARLIWTASSVNYYFRPPIKFDTLEDGQARRALGVTQLYCQSKFATVLLVKHLAKTCKDDGVIVIVVDPGNIKSDLQRYGPDSAIKGALRSAMHSMILHPVELGALTQLYCGTAPEAADYNGRYLRPWARLGEPHKGTNDVQAQEEMWDYCDGEVKAWV